MDRKLMIVSTGTGTRAAPLSATLERTLRHFLKANSIPVQRHFGKPDEYLMNDCHYSKDEVLRTADFAGFVDGYHQQAHRYQGPHGTPRQAAQASPLTAIIDDLVKRTRTSPDPGAADLLEMIARVRLETPQQKYERQYTLGWSCAGSGD